MNTTLTHPIVLQLGQEGEGMNYNPNKRLPYPMRLDTDGWLKDNFSPGDPDWKLIGFQEGDEQTVVLLVDEFVADVQRAVGLVPVFSDGRGFFSLSDPVTNVTDYRTEET